MSELAFDMSGGVDPNTGIVRAGRENQVYVRFYRGSKRDNYTSQQEGIPIEKQVDYVEVRQFGEKDSTILEVNELHKRRWPQAWASYANGLEAKQDGTPLDVPFPRNPEVVNTLKANNIWTIQALAAVPDSVGAIPFIGDHKKKAKEFLSGLDGGKRFHALESELEKQQLQNMELVERIQALEASLAQKPKPSKE